MNKKYYWLRLKEDFFEEDTIAWLEEQENGKEYALFYLKLCLKSLKTNGLLIRNVGDILLPYDTRKLGEITKTDYDTVAVAMELFRRIGLVQILDNGEIYLSQLQKMIGSAVGDEHLRESNRLRQQRFREKQKMLSQCDNNVTITLHRNVEIENRDNIEKETISKDIVKKKNVTNATTLTQRRDDFYNSLIPFLEKYEKEMMREFFEYWSEPNQTKTKMRFEMEKTWDTSRRLATWAKRDNNFNNNGQRFNSASNYESATDKRRREQQEYAGRLAEKIQQRISNSSRN